jgi:riboflavin synthase
MFTGLVEVIGTVTRVTVDGPAKRFVIDAPFCRELALGESVAINGACLTVVERDEKSFTVQAGPETLRCTNLGELNAGTRVNLERSVRLSDRLGGHLVQGHIDGVALISERKRQDEWEFVWFGCAPELTAFMIPKGSVTIDGVSLTLVDVERDRFSVALIPHTLTMTTLGLKSIGERVNLETDIIGKYVKKFIV